MGASSSGPRPEATWEDWERRVALAWDSLEEHSADAFRQLIEELAAELPVGSAVADFERGCSFDSTGHPARAVELYEQALAAGLTGIRRRRAVIQLASSLRNLGRPAESVTLLTPELDAPSDELDDAVRATLALALTSLGRDREAVSLVITALARHLPRYQRSMTRYARQLVETDAAAADSTESEQDRPPR
ncbi:tetratricopeptide repeat protein [Streptomyces oceani]|uniref:Tetratrico peptide repeat group 5 domain-containing protein n=1 Tax=Streptomyces oceani TaxID=1075402 RepID=A0A1E7JZB2_9ACTN|nr:tetratricopeptide repeat protein [Streptomyces oceani]OEU96936.1 hypothetical protein AN216_18505 [Streptomyces oceani]